MLPRWALDRIPPHHFVALDHAWLWIRAALVPANRLLSDDTSGLPDALLLLLALRQVYRAAEMSSEAVTRPAAKKIINDAIDDFKEAFPDVKDARDIVEHFDNYAVGVGKLQTVPTMVGMSKDQLARAFATRYEGTGRQFSLTVGSRRIDIDKVHEAMFMLFRRMWDAVEAEEGPEAYIGVPREPWQVVGYDGSRS